MCVCCGEAGGASRNSTQTERDQNFPQCEELHISGNTLVNREGPVTRLRAEAGCLVKDVVGGNAFNRGLVILGDL